LLADFFVSGHGFLKPPDRLPVSVCFTLGREIEMAGVTVFVARLGCMVELRAESSQCLKSNPVILRFIQQLMLKRVLPVRELACLFPLRRGFSQRVLKMKLISILLFVAASAFDMYALAESSDSNDHNQFELGIGIMSSSEQKDVLDRVYSDAETSGGGAMLNLEIGYAIKFGDHVSVVPNVNWAILRVKTPTLLSGYSNESYNDYLMPGVALRYNFIGHGKGFYVGAKLASVNPTISDKLSRIDSIESDGKATGFFVGYMFGRLHLEVGKLEIPVKVDASSMPLTKADFGGGYFMLRSAF
jgi:hypothetical protein